MPSAASPGQGIGTASAPVPSYGSPAPATSASSPTHCWSAVTTSLGASPVLSNRWVSEAPSVRVSPRWRSSDMPTALVSGWLP